MYPLAAYEAMLADDVRVRAYLEAIRRTVRDGDIVLELGTGVGFFAVAACRAGAAHVYAIEPNDAITLGPQVAAANGCAERITFVQASSGRVSLPVRADVLIEDMRGVLPIAGDRLDVLADAKARLLTDVARMIPLRDSLWAAPVRMPASLSDSMLTEVAPHGIEVTALQRLVRNTWHRTHAEATDTLAAPRRWADVDPMTGASEVEGGGNWTVAVDGTMAGWCVWFDSELADGVHLCCSPLAARTIYGQAFFPLEHPCAVRAGTNIEALFRARRSENDYAWVWESRIRHDDGTELHARQSSLAGMLLDARRLRTMAQDAQPSATLQVRVNEALLHLVDGHRTLREIGRLLLHAHPTVFRDEQDALRFAAGRLDAINREERLRESVTFLDSPKAER